MVDESATGAQCGDQSFDRDRRLVRVRLTTDGEQRLDQLVPAHIDELQQLAPILDHVVAHAASTTLPS